MSARRTARRAAWIVVVAVALSLGCSHDKPADRADPTLTTPTTAASSTTTTTEPERIEAEPPEDEPRPDIDVNVTYPADFTAEQAAVAEAYRGYWHAAYLINDPCGPTEVGQPAACLPDPAAAPIADFASQDRQSAVVAAAIENRNANQVLILRADGRYQHLITEVMVEGEVATIRDCAVDDAVVLDASSGSVVDDDVVTRDYLVSLANAGGSWRVTGKQLSSLHEWTGEEIDQCVSGG